MNKLLNILSIPKLLFVLTFVICVFPKLVPLAIILFFVGILFDLRQKKFEFHFPKIYLFFVLFYAAYFIGVFFTNNQKLANHYLESKISFVIFPLLFALLTKKKDDANLKYAFLGIIWGVIVLFFIGFTHSIQSYLSGIPVLESFFSVNFSNIHHPSYYAAFILFSFLCY